MNTTAAAATTSWLNIGTTTLPAETAVYAVVYSFYFSCPINGGWDSTTDYFTNYGEAREYTSKLRGQVGKTSVRGYKSTIAEETKPLEW